MIPTTMTCKGLRSHFNFLGQQETRSRKAVILSDVLQSGQPASELYSTIGQLLGEQGVDLLWE